ncbi:cyclic lactone autoinducer peptide [Coprobacillus sp. AM23-9LB]|jgi:cyclic lactone autoinducer peptide|nr:cyclic lactone autoinducer peptide [Coprobacillus sp. AM23-9LB]RGH98246.1 cyclic lactone autoinducer peptide [Coprobacillus sp. AM26-5AC]RHT87764.1 cyclic lactone autoinducer peptide [Coprobacillus sp. AM28-15LB]
MMKKVLKFLSLFVLVVAEFAANTPSQLGSYQMDAPKQLKK